jgi:hypothetical protein
MQANNQVILHDDNRQLDQQLMDMEAPFGPLELSILERVESGLQGNAVDESDDPKKLSFSKTDKQKFVGKREVIFVTGWVNIDAAYTRYLWGFVSKILIGLLVMFSLQHNNQNFWPVAAGFVAINAIHALKGVYYVLHHWNSHPNIKIGLWLDFNIALGYLVYFSGFLLAFTEQITMRYLPLFTVPYLAFAVVMFFVTDDENFLMSQKKFQIFEAVQFLLIAMKVSQVDFINWNYTLIYFMASSIYLTVLGLLLSIILSCSLFGFLYNNLETWKLKSLVWMTWLYLWSGTVYIYFIKGIIQFYQEDNFIEVSAVADYVHYKAPNYRVLEVSALFMIGFSFVNLIFHLLWSSEIKRYLAKVIYRNEQRKEISLRLFAKSFTFNLIQVSATYFTKPDPANSSSISKDDSVVNITADSETPIACENGEPEPCLFCCETDPNIMFDPCGHGGICKKCSVQYLKFNEGTCPFCKGTIDKLFLLEQDPKTHQFVAKGEISFKE